LKEYLEVNNELHEHHVIVLETTYPSGAQEWFCPSCARRFIVQLQPIINVIELEVGDVYVDHVGSTHGYPRIGIEIRDVGPEEPELPEEIITALEKVLKDIDFDELDDTAD
jgi:hypothetical protein